MRPLVLAILFASSAAAAGEIEATVSGWGPVAAADAPVAQPAPSLTPASAEPKLEPWMVERMTAASVKRTWSIVLFVAAAANGAGAVLMATERGGPSEAAMPLIIGMGVTSVFALIGGWGLSESAAGDEAAIRAGRDQVAAR